MATKVYNVRSPDGTIIKVRGPEGASPEQVIAQAKRLGAGAPSEAPQGAVQPPQGAAPGVGGTTPQGTPAAPPAPNATPPAVPRNPDGSVVQHGFELNPNWNVDEMSGLQKFAAGYGGVAPGLVRGAKQLFASGDDAERLRAEEKEARERMAPLTDTGAGFAGNLTGNIAAALPLAAATTMAAPALGTAGVIAAGGAEGAGMGALAPTAEEGERAENVMWGGGLGLGIPVLGKGARALAGEVNPAMQKAAEVLGRYGVKVPKGDVAPGGLSRGANYILRRTPGISHVLKASNEAKEDTVRTALFKMLGHDVPESNEAMEGILNSIGDEVGAASAGKHVDMSTLAPKITAVMKEYKQLLPSQRKPEIIKQANELMTLANLPNAKLRGEAYQAIRSTMSAEAKKAGPVHGKAIRGLRTVLDDAFDDVLSPAEAAKHATKKEQYRLAKVLRNADIKEGKVDLRRARTVVENASKNAPVMPAARDLLSASNLAIPKISASVGPTALAEGVAMFTHPALLAKTLIGGMGGKALTNTGLPQYIARSPRIQTAIGAALRGAGRRELSDED